MFIFGSGLVGSGLFQYKLAYPGFSGSLRRMKLLVALSVLSAFCSAALAPSHNGAVSSAFASASASASAVEEEARHSNVVELLSKLTSALGSATQKVENPENPLQALRNMMNDAVGNLDWNSAKGKHLKDSFGDNAEFAESLDSDKVAEMLSPLNNVDLSNKVSSHIHDNLAGIMGDPMTKQKLDEIQKRFLDKVTALGKGDDLKLENLFDDSLGYQTRNIFRDL